mgnify:CR=1 FL=1
MTKQEKHLRKIEAEVAELEARGSEIRRRLVRHRRDREDVEGRIIEARGRGQTTDELEAESDRLAQEIRRDESTLSVVIERELAEKRTELADAQRRYLEVGVRDTQAALTGKLSGFEERWRAALEPLLPEIAECRTHVGELRALHAQRRRLQGRGPLQYAPELEAVYRQAGHAAHQLVVLAELLEHGFIPSLGDGTAQARTQGATADVLRRLEGDGGDDIAKRLGMRR